MLALYYYAGDSECELTFQDLHVEATVHAKATVIPSAIAVRPSTLTRTLTNLNRKRLLLLHHRRYSDICIRVMYAVQTVACTLKYVNVVL